MTGRDVAAALGSRGYDFFSGVPCSLLADLIRSLAGDAGRPYVPAVREDVAVGLAAGAWLGGRRTAVLMQNSGLGTSANALASLSLLYRLPALLMISWRGHGGHDAPEHLLTGRISRPWLDLLGIPHRVPSAASLEEDIAWASVEADRLSQPVALLLPPGAIEADTQGAGPRPTPGVRTPEPAPRHGEKALGPNGRGPEPRISRLEALRATLGAIGQEPVIHANGYICRESFAVKDRPGSFYMVGSMGLASAIGLGVSLAVPDRAVVVLDGDGNLLMGLGTLAMIGGGPVPGGPRAQRLVHVVFDNEVYGSTGNQDSLSRSVRLERLARAAGYAHVTAVTEAAEIRAAVGRALIEPGPAFVLVKVTAEEQPAPRIPYAPEEIRDRFREALR